MPASKTDGGGLTGCPQSRNRDRRRRSAPRRDRAVAAALHEPHVLHLASWFVFPRRTVTTTPSPSAAAQRADLALPHPRHEEQPRDHRVEAAALEGDLLRTHARGRAGAAGWQVARTAARSAERPRLPPASIAGRPPVAGQDPGGSFPGRARLTGEASPEARRGDRRRRARRRPALVRGARRGRRPRSRPRAPGRRQASRR